MATTNAKLYNRMDTIQNWTDTSNPKQLQPKEAAFIEGTNTFVVNNTGTVKTFNELYGYGTDNAGKTSSCYVCAFVPASTAPGNGTISVTKVTNSGRETFTTFTVNQSTNTSINLPNFVNDATIEFPAGKVNTFIESAFKSPGQPVQQFMPNCMPIDLVVVALREIFSKIGNIKNAQGEDIDTLDLAQKGLQAAINLLPYKNQQ